GGGTFFMRTEFSLPGLGTTSQDLELAFKPIAGRFGMQWRLAYAARPKRLAVFVSRADHALLELLWQHQAGDLAADIALVISNHTNNAELAERQGIPFFHVPISPDTRAQAEADELRLLVDHH